MTSRQHAPESETPQSPIEHCKHCGEEIPDGNRNRFAFTYAESRGGKTVLYCCYECFCDD